MKIRGFSKYIENYLEEFNLAKSTIVIDAQNYFYNIYENEGLVNPFGCQSDKFAEILRKNLNNFITNNVRAIFIFQGGHQNIEKRLHKLYTNPINDLSHPIFQPDVCFEVLREMNFEFYFCVFEAKMDCIAYAKSLECLVSSHDATFCVSPVPYIPYNTIQFTHTLKCHIYNLDKFLKAHKLSIEKFAYFVVLKDTDLFPDGSFDPIFKYLRISGKNFMQIKNLLGWMSRNNFSQIEDIIFKLLTSDQKSKFYRYIDDVLNKISGEAFVNNGLVEFINNEKLRSNEENMETKIRRSLIPRPYINLFYYGIIIGSWIGILDEKNEDALVVSKEIIKYAYDIMNQFKNKNYQIVNNNGNEITISSESSIEKPAHIPHDFTFALYKNIRDLGLFKFFIAKTLPDLMFAELENIPNQEQMLFIALQYYSKKTNTQSSSLVCSILLSFIMLNTYDAKNNENLNYEIGKENKTRTNNLEINCDDIRTASEELDQFISVKYKDPNQKIIRQLTEFQHCLNHLNYLNVICGSELKSTIYNKTYNGVFVYNMSEFFWDQTLKEINDQLEIFLGAAPSVFNYFQQLVKTYLTLG